MIFGATTLSRTEAIVGRVVHDIWPGGRPTACAVVIYTSQLVATMRS